MKIRKNELKIYMIFCCCVFAIPILKSPLPLIAYEIFLSLYYMKQSDERIFLLFVILCLSQNILMIVFSDYFTNTTITLLMFTKEFLLYLSTMKYIFEKKIAQLTINIVDIMVLLFLGYCLLIIMLKGGKITYHIIALRQILIPIVCYYFGMGIKADRNKINKIVIGMGISLSVIGIIIYMLPMESFWTSIGYLKYVMKQNGTTTGAFTSFYTYDFGIKLNRFVSFTAAPLATVHYLVFVLLIVHECYKKRWKVMKVVLIICIMLSISKFVIVAIAGYLVIKLYTSSRRSFNKMFFGMVLITAALFGYGYLQSYGAGLSEETVATATSNHYDSFSEGIKNATLLGNGLGTAGYNLAQYSKDIPNFDSKTIESFFATILSQLGVIGVFLFYCIITAIIIDLYKEYMRNNNRKELIVGLMLGLMITMESIFSASSIATIGSGIYFVYIGIVASDEKRLQKT